MSSLAKWNPHESHQNPSIRQNVISIGQFIWYSIAHKSHSEGENGMVQFCTKKNKIIQIIEYPDNIKPCRHYCCKYNHQIYIIDGEHGEIILFDTITLKFTKKLDIPNIGQYPCAIIKHDKIRIFHGSNNDKQLIYDIKTNTIKIINGSEEIQNPRMTMYQDKIIR